MITLTTPAMRAVTLHEPSWGEVMPAPSSVVVVISGVSLSGSEVISIVGPGMYGENVNAVEEVNKYKCYTDCLSELMVYHYVYTDL